MPTTLKDLAGENAGAIVGTIANGLKQIERAVPELKGLADEFRGKAYAGNYAELCAVSEEYALRYLADSLQASEGDLTSGAEEVLD